MTANGWFQIGLFLLVILALTKPLGVFIARVFNQERTFLDPLMRPLERLLYRVTGVDEKREMRWTEYAIAMLLFSGVSMLLLYLIERVQVWLPWNPQGWGNVAPDLAFNTAVIYDEHELASLFRRNDNELFHPDGRAGVPQLHVRRDRNSPGNSRDPRSCPA